MKRLLLRAVVFLGSAALGLLAAALLIPAVTLSPAGFVLAVVVFALSEAVLTPLSSRIAAAWAPAFVGGVGILSTLLALVLASLVPGGIEIDGWRAWVLGAVIVWLVTALADRLLSLLLLRRPAAGDARRPAGAQRGR